jgi:hypothetical protein
MRKRPARLILLPLIVTGAVTCAGCALMQKPATQSVAQAPAPNQLAAAAPPAAAPSADAPPRFECSDGTISVSQTGCLVNMAHARLPASQADERAPESAH